MKCKMPLCSNPARLASGLCSQCEKRVSAFYRPIRTNETAWRSRRDNIESGRFWDTELIDYYLTD